MQDGSTRTEQLGSLAILSLGSNVGNKRSHLKWAIQKLSSTKVQIVQASSIYLTEPVDYPYQDWFLNQALVVRTQLTPHHLLIHCVKVEKMLGRRRHIVKGPRPIDVDILLYSDQIINGKELIIPHPRLHLRRFVLIPVAEIASDFRHPILRDSIGGLLKQCRDSAEVVHVL